MTRNPLIECQICHQQKPASQVLPSDLVRNSVLELIKRQHPEWSPSGYVCLADLNRYRALHVEEMLQSERGELSQLEQDVVHSLQDEELLAENVEEELAGKATYGEKLSDRLASFGGSWTFIGLFGAVLVAWIVSNTTLVTARPFDPFPFILLNLVLSCIAAIQAPVIMMSQNRQEAKDRARAEHDFRINLKAEVEIRQLHAKLDLLLTHQWQRLLEIQQLQVDLMGEIAAKK